MPAAWIEDIVTTACAHALALEGERLRTERRIGEQAQRLAEGDPDAQTAIATLAERIAATQAELAELRGVLAVLRRTASAARAAERAA